MIILHEDFHKIASVYLNIRFGTKNIEEYCKEFAFRCIIYKEIINFDNAYVESILIKIDTVYVLACCLSISQGVYESGALYSKTGSLLMYNKLKENLCQKLNQK